MSVVWRWAKTWLDGKRSEKKARKVKSAWKVCKKKERRPVATPDASSEARDQQARLVSEVTSIRHESTDLICPICLKFVCHATLTECGHSFCDVCLLEYLLVASACIVCNSNIPHRSVFSRCKRLDSIVEQLVADSGDRSEQLDYASRKRQRKEYQENRRLATVETGKLLDVRSPEHVWCVGVIKKVYYRQDANAKGLLIHYLVGAREAGISVRIRRNPRRKQLPTGPVPIFHGPRRYRRLTQTCQN